LITGVEAKGISEVGTGTSLNLTMFSPGVFSKPSPVMVTSVPVYPNSGLKFTIFGQQPAIPINKHTDNETEILVKKPLCFPENMISPHLFYKRLFIPSGAHTSRGSPMNQPASIPLPTDYISPSFFLGLGFRFLL
jgi:hypothetical protein